MGLLDIKESDIHAKVHNVEHHMSHMSSSFLCSKFRDAAILSIDGFGDFSSTMTAIGSDNKIRKLRSVNYPHSLGIFYTAVTQFLGFKNYGDEYKVMGLSSYGESKYLDQFEDIIYKINDGFFGLNKEYFTHIKQGVAMQWKDGMPEIDSLFTKRWEDLFGFTARLKNDDLEQFHMDFASSAQKHTENILFHILEDLYSKTGIDNICVTGGVAQNSVANGKILDNTSFKNIYIGSASHDAGTSIGSALYVYNHVLGNARNKEVKNSSFGSRFSNSQIIHYLDTIGIDYIKLNDDELFDKVTDKLIDGCVVGWFQGRSEFGPRALGNRSILVDPTRKDAKDLLNNKIKRRENFRPFAPSILENHVSEYFTDDLVAPFMERVCQIKEEKHSKIPAVTHIDGTGRLQSVSKNISPRYYRLINTFFRKSGVPLLLNTSFNENEPIVNTPKEAIDCYLRTNMDMLVMENIILER